MSKIAGGDAEIASELEPHSQVPFMKVRLYWPLLQHLKVLLPQLTLLLMNNQVPWRADHSPAGGSCAKNVHSLYFIWVILFSCFKQIKISLFNCKFTWMRSSVRIRLLAVWSHKWIKSLTWWTHHFSINFNWNVVTSFNSRIECLLELLGIQDLRLEKYHQRERLSLARARKPIHQVQQKNCKVWSDAWLHRRKESKPQTVR